MQLTSVVCTILYVQAGVLLVRIMLLYDIQDIYITADVHIDVIKLKVL